MVAAGKIGRVDTLLLGLYSASLVTTVSGAGYGAFDVVRRVRTYRTDAADGQDRPRYSQADLSILYRNHPKRYHQAKLEIESADRQRVDRQLAALAGATDTLWPLVASVALVFVGALLGGCADILAVVRGP